MNVHRVQLYRHQDGWAFDDFRHGLVAEALIEGADTLVDRIVEFFGWQARDRFWLEFCDTPGRFSFGLYKTGESNGGTDYVVENPPFEGHKVWLCPALGCYFPVAPRYISLMVSPLSAGEASTGESGGP